MIFFIIILELVFSQIPYQFNNNEIINNPIIYSRYESGLNSNQLINIEVLSNDSEGSGYYDTIFLGTTNGLNIASYYSAFEYELSNHSDENLVGGNPALTVKDNVVAVSGVAAYSTSTGAENGGTGISYSVDGGHVWSYIEQPLDQYNSLSNPDYTNKYACPWGEYNDSSLFTDKEQCSATCVDCSGSQRSCAMYDYISWGEQNSILNFSVTTNIHNISYGLAVHGDYIYAASWAGTLRRFNYKESNPIWEVVPLPMDDQYHLKCNEINTSLYQINPVGNYVNSGDCGYEFDNHKVFSVYSVEDTLWVGTAAGINKGIVSEGGCIDWIRLTSDNNGFYDDWVIGFENQVLDEDNGLNRIWAITWDRRYDGSHLTYGGPPSYSDNGGYTWETPDYLKDDKVITYNISTYSDICYVSSDQGLFVALESSNMELWQKWILPDYIISNSVYDAELIYYGNDPDPIFYGHTWIASSPLIVDSWHQQFHSSDGNIENIFYAYPNPFMIDEDGYLTFSYNGDEGNVSGSIDIYDFGMDKVISLTPLEITTWDGRNQFGNQVANGVYLCEYVHSDNSKNYFNIMVINSK